MRKDLLKLMTVMRVVEEAGDELAAVEGGDEQLSHAKEVLRASRRFQKVRISFALDPGAISTRP